MKKFFKWFGAIVALLLMIYFAGPHPASPQYTTDLPAVPSNAQGLEAYIKSNEARHRLKPDNEARIVWANEQLKLKTEYAIVYLHGFSASQGEGDPIHRKIAKDFGCNLYLARLAEHGIDTIDPMRNLTATKYWESAKQALAIGKQLGNKVILVGTSTGGTNALQLAAAYPVDVAALVLLSPNVAINNDKAYLLNNPWGLQLAKLVTGQEVLTAKDTRPLYKKYWYNQYRLEPTVELEELIETTMNEETFQKVRQPTLMLYYYKDAVHHDSVVSVPALLKMFDELATSPGKKIKKPMPKAGDHVLGSSIKSADVPGVEREIENFMTTVIGMKNINADTLRAGQRLATNVR
jgi:pimeloyl-ACP methyl ester carboxylesterase